MLVDVASVSLDLLEPVAVLIPLVIEHLLSTHELGQAVVGAHVGLLGPSLIARGAHIGAELGGQHLLLHADE